MNVLIACEESQAVCKVFRKKGHRAFSCDLLDCSGGAPEWHVKGNVLDILNGDCIITTCDSQFHRIDTQWDLIIAHPPCTFLTNAGNRWFDVEKYGEAAIQRAKDREEAIEFFMRIANCHCKRIAIENPIGVMSTRYRKPNQIIHPYMFGDPERKATCLWLKNLPNLKPTNVVEPNIIHYKNGKGTDSPWHMNTMSLPKEERSKERSKTFWGIANAMGEQWG